MVDTKSPDTTKKGKTNPLIFVGIGCLALLVILGIAGSLISKFVFKKAGTSLLQNLIEKKTGVKTNLGDLEKGQMTFTDEKTGTKVDIGSNKLPDTFPKDFPVYPGSKVTAVLSGTEQGKSSGFWVTLTTPDSLDKVTAYYKTGLKTNGWTETASYTSGDTTTQTVSKGVYSGTIGITRGADSSETEIVIMIGEEKQTTPQE
jgi:hypothetical protein